MLAVLWLVPLILFSCALTYGWKATWTAVGIPSFAPPFLDLRVITSGLVTLRHGGDPLVSNPFDPLGRNLNCPRIWLVRFSLLGINDRNEFIVGIVLCALFLACMSKPNRLDGPVRESQQHSEMFAIFGAIYAFCFIAGSNWDYRLIFLIPTLPFAFIRARQREYKYWSMAYIILVIFSENSMDLGKRSGAILAHLASLLTFLFVLTILTQQIKTMGFGAYSRPKPCCQTRNETRHGFAGAEDCGSSSLCEFPAYFSGELFGEDLTFLTPNSNAAHHSSSVGA